MINPSDKVKYMTEEGVEKETTFTEFELLKAEVEELKNLNNEMAEILRQNNLPLKIHARNFDQQDVIKRLVSEE